MKKDGKTNSLKMTNKKEKYMLITVPLPVRKSGKKVLLTVTPAMFSLLPKYLVEQDMGTVGEWVLPQEQ